jgi:hypothetical protein
MAPFTLPRGASLQRKCPPTHACLERPTQVALAVPKLCLLLGVMRRLDIQTIHYHETNGSCLGLLLLAEGATH